jgi:TonB family protein
MKPITIMLILSASIHLVVLTLLAILPWLSSRKIRAPVYPVTLITQPAPEPKVEKPKVKVAKKPREKPPEKPKKKPVTVKKPKPKPKPKKKVALKKKRVKEDTISEKRVQRKRESRIEELRKKVKTEEKPEPIKEVPQVARKPSRAVIDMRLKTYYNSIWQRIKEEWILPGSLLEESEDWETIIVIKVQRDGVIVDSWFEKKSGSPVYDESAMRAIKKANPLPPLPQDLDEDFLEIGIRFHPEQG